MWGSGYRVCQSPKSTVAGSVGDLAATAGSDYADYQRKTDRDIPVFVLTPIH